MAKKCPHFPLINPALTRIFPGLSPVIDRSGIGKVRWAGLLTQSLRPSLSSVQCFSDTNQMNTHNLAIVFGPTLFQTDGQDYKAGHVVEDLINHYVVVFSVRP